MSLTQLQIVCESGVDATKHRLVTVLCGRCGSTVVMRKASVARNKSCGCLKRDTFHAFVVRRKRERESKTKPLPPSQWTPYDDSMIGPAMILTKVLGRGLTRYGTDHDY